MLRFQHALSSGSRYNVRGGIGVTNGDFIVDELNGWKDKALFTPGPLTTSQTVKQAMLRDVGSRDEAFIAIVREIRQQLARLANVSATHSTIPMQGSGTFAIEAVLSTVVPRDGKLLVAVNGSYGARIAHMARTLGIDCAEIPSPENAPVDPAAIKARLGEDAAITHVAVVHCETTTGLLNPIEAIGEIAKRAGRVYIVDAMSSFGAIPIDAGAAHIDYLVSSANKCIEGVPGFAFAIARNEALDSCAGQSRSLSLDLHAQWKGLEANGQFRFTPPTHAILAFHRALSELEAEGGVAARGARYQRNHGVLIHGMRILGFEEYLPEALQSCIITSFRFPDHPNFEFEAFYSKLSERGVLIYPGKVTDADCFRIGTIGRLFESDVECLLAAIRCVLEELEIELPGTIQDVLTKL